MPSQFKFEEGLFTITFPNGVEVAISAENYDAEDTVARAYVTHKRKAKNLLLDPNCPPNRELTGNGLIKLLVWAEEYDGTTLS